MSDIYQIQKKIEDLRSSLAREEMLREYDQAVAVLRLQLKLQLEMQKNAAEQWRIMHLPQVEIEV